MTNLTFKVRPISEVLRKVHLNGEGSLVEQVYALLRELIINLSLPPEYPIVEQEVANQLTISKTPVREAIIRLSREGLVNVVPKSGSYVTPVNLDRYLEACFVRTQLESGCVRRLALQGVKLSDQARLRSHITDQVNALRDNNESAFFKSDEAFHKCLFDVAGLSGVWQMMKFAKAELDRVRHLKRKFGHRQRKLVIDEHKALIEAIISQDPEGAEQALLENIGGVEDEINSFSQQPQLLRTIQDLNQLVSMDHRNRGSRGVASSS